MFLILNPEVTLKLKGGLRLPAVSPANASGAHVENSRAFTMSRIYGNANGYR